MRDKDGYWYKNETLIDRLGITSKEQKYMKTIIGLDEKYDRNNERRRNKRRNEEGLTKRQIEQKNNIDNIKMLKIQGLSQSKVAKELSIGIATVKRYWNL